MGLSGGLALWWKEESNLYVIDKNKNLINVRGRVKNQPKTWHWTFVYADPMAEKRKRIWENLKGIARSMAMPRLVAGDFSIIGSFGEKGGGTANSIKKVEEMQHIISECCLMEMSFSGV